MAARHNDIGKRFNRLTCIGYGPLHVSPAGKTHRTMHCVCDCGNEKTALAVSIRSGRTTSCGCAQVNRGTLKHGFGRQGSDRRHPLYSIWGCMRSRCNSPSTTGYQHYGGRGIKCCDRWADFEAFLADMGPRPPGHTLDRINVNGDYEPENCRWADRKTQANNTTRSVRYLMGDVAMTVSEVAPLVGIKAATIRSRIRRGWDFTEAIQK